MLDGRWAFIRTNPLRNRKPIADPKHYSHSAMSDRPPVRASSTKTVTGSGLSGLSAARLFGHDIFVSFALGGPPRGTQSYASDLARRLRERDFSVFFSEDQAAPGSALAATLERALQRARMLVLVANHGTLADPRWVRHEVEQFSRAHPSRPIVVINVADALRDEALSATTRAWLPVDDRIWIDETDDAVARGIVSPAVIERLAIAPTHLRANARWRWLARGVGTALAALAATAGVAALVASRNAEEATRQRDLAEENRRRAESGEAAASASARDATEQRDIARTERTKAEAETVRARAAEADAREQLARATALRLAAEGQAILGGVRPLDHQRGILQVLIAHRAAPQPAIDSILHDSALRLQPLQWLRHAGGPISHLVSTTDGLIVATTGITGASGMRIWRAGDGHHVRDVAEVAPDPISALTAMPDGSHLAIGTERGQVQVWDAGQGRAMGPPRREEIKPVVALRFSEDARELWSASHGVDVLAWPLPLGSAPPARLPWTVGRDLARRQPADGNAVWLTLLDSGHASVAVTPVDRRGDPGISLEGHESGVTAAVFAPGADSVLTSSSDGTVRRWDARTGAAVGLPMPHPDGAAVVAIDPHGRWAASGGFDGSVRLWSLADRGKTPTTPDAVWRAQAGSVTTMHFVAGRPQVLSSDSEGWVASWSLDRVGPWLHRASAAHRGGVRALAFAPDGLRIASAGADRAIRIWNAADLRPMARRDGAHKDTVASLAFDRAGRQLVSGGFDDSIGRWDAHTLEPLGPPMSGHRGVVSGIAVDPVGLRIASAGGDRTFRQWRLRDGQPLGEASKTHLNLVSAVAYAEGGRTLVTASWDRTLQRWDASSGAPLGRPWTGHSERIVAMAHSAAMGLVASGDYRGELRLWRDSTGSSAAQPVVAHPSGIEALVFSPDGKYLASAGRDRLVRLWHVPSLAPVGNPMAGHGGEVHALAISPDARLLVSADSQGVLLSWPGPASWADLLCARLERNPTLAEWREWTEGALDITTSKAPCPNLPWPTAVAAGSAATTDRSRRR